MPSSVCPRAGAPPGDLLFVCQTGAAAEPDVSAAPTPGMITASPARNNPRESLMFFALTAAVDPAVGLLLFSAASLGAALGVPVGWLLRR